MNLRQLVDPNLVFDDLAPGSRDAVLRGLADRLESRGSIRNADDLYAKLLEREELGSTAIGRGVAIPHCKLSQLEQALVAVGLVPRGVEVETPDREPVRLFFLVVSPEGSPAEHLRSLAAIAKWLKSDRNLERISGATTRDEVTALLQGSSEGGDRG